MKEAEIKAILERKGYTLDKITRFKKKDRIHWHDKDLKVSLDLGKKIEALSREQFSQWVL